MMILAHALHLNVQSVAVLAGLIAVLGAEIIVSQRNKKMVPARIKRDPQPNPQGQNQGRNTRTTR